MRFSFQMSYRLQIRRDILLLYSVRNYRMCIICRKDGLGIANTLRALGRIDTYLRYLTFLKYLTLIIITVGGRKRIAKEGRRHGII